MAMTQHLHLWLDLKQPLLGGRQIIAAGKIVAGDGLGVSVDERTPRDERLAKMVARVLSCALGVPMRLWGSRAVELPSSIYNLCITFGWPADSAEWFGMR